MSKNSNNDLTFENAMIELEEVTQRLENGKDTLEESMNLYERGIYLKEFCEKKLKEAEGKWSVLRKQKDSSIEEVPLSKEEKEELMPNQNPGRHSDLF